MTLGVKKNLKQDYSIETQQKDLSNFRLRLQALLTTSFPEKANDQKAIDQSSSCAANAYEYDLLYTEVTGTIAIWVEENGLLKKQHLRQNIDGR